MTKLFKTIFCNIIKNQSWNEHASPLCYVNTRTDIFSTSLIQTTWFRCQLECKNPSIGRGVTYVCARISSTVWQLFTPLSLLHRRTTKILINRSIAWRDMTGSIFPRGVLLHRLSKQVGTGIVILSVNACKFVRLSKPEWHINIINRFIVSLEAYRNSTFGEHKSLLMAETEPAEPIAGPVLLCKFYMIFFRTIIV